MSSILLITILFLTVSMCSTGHAEAAVEKPLERWDFTTAKDTLEWTALHSVDPLSVENNALQMRITASDPYIGSPWIELTTGNFQYIRVTMKSEVRDGGQIFWAAGVSRREAGFNGNDSANFSIMADGKFHTYYILPFWKAGETLYRIRIDTPDGAGKLVEIKDVAIIERNVSGDPPSKPNYDFSDPGMAAFWMPYQDLEEMPLENDALKVRVSGEMPAIVSPPCEIKSDEARFLTFRTSVTGCSQAEVWYSTGSGFPPPNRHSFQIIPDGKFHIYNIDLSEARGYDGTITRMAIALVGATSDTQWLVQSVGLNPAPSGPGEAVIKSFEIESAVVWAGKAAKAYCEVVNVGGASMDDLEVEIVCPKDVYVLKPGTAHVGDARRKLPQLNAAQSTVCEWDVMFATTGEIPAPTSIQAKLLRSGEVAGTRSASAIVSRSWGSDGTVLLESRTKDESKRVMLVFPGNTYGYGVGLVHVRQNGKWVQVASMRNLGSLSTADGELHPLYAATRTHTGKGIEFPLLHKDEKGRQWRGKIVFTSSQDSPFIEVSSSISCSEDAELTHFSLPDLLVGDGSFGRDRDIGLFPGLEYLLPGERSSGLDFCATPVNNRLVPHPNKVTIPLMAVIYDGIMTGIMWDPLQQWDGSHDRPCAKFASPNFVDDQRNHLMGLFAPAIPEWTQENALEASKPYKLKAGQEITLTARIFAAPGDDADDVIKLWFDSVGGIPEPPEMPYDYREHIRAAIRDYTETSWIPEESKWHRAINDPWGPAYVPMHVLHLMWEIARGELPQEELEMAKKVLDAASKKQLETNRNLGQDLAFYQGPVNQLLAPPGWFSRFERQIRDDGTFPFRPDAKHSVFGKTGDTSSGHTARSLVNVFRYARATGDEEAIELGIKGLEYLDSQMRPEGAQTWELQLHVPDVLAAAHAVDCYIAAYELTRDEKFLDQARLWAYRGLPFIYLWNPADRPVMRYGSIPVFGATWFTGGWFGRIVQWNGLVYAISLLKLAEYDTTMDWSTIAEGITISGIQQQRPIDYSTYRFKDNIPDCGHAGMYPDAYSAVTGTDAYHWCLSGGRIAENAYKIMGSDPAVKHTIIWSQDEKHRAHVSSAAYIEDALFTDDRLRFTVTFGDHPYREAHYIVVANIAEPVSISKNQVSLDRVDDLDSASEGCQWMPQIRAIVVKIRQNDDSEILEFEF